MHALWKRRTQESILQIQDCNMFKPRKVWSLESWCVETRTHMKLRKVQMNPIQKSLSKKFGVWMFKTLSTMVTVSAPRTLTYFQNIVMSQNSKNSQKIAMSQRWCGRSESVNRSRTTEEDSERVAYQVKVQEKIQTTWLFDTEADEHVMPKYEWEQLGEPTLRTTRVTLRGANGQDLGAMGVLPVRKFHSENQSSVHSSGCTRRCLLSGTQVRAKGYTFTLNQQESFFTQP